MDDKTAVTGVLTDYYNAFSTLDVKAIVALLPRALPVYYPSQRPTHAAMTEGFTAVTEGLRARGYSRSELSMLHVKQLSATAT